jgi:hypothetical protein
MKHSMRRALIGANPRSVGLKAHFVFSFVTRLIQSSSIAKNDPEKHHGHDYNQQGDDR